MTTLDWSVLDIDYAAEADRIATRLREVTARELHKRGLVVAISGGIDSSCSIALAVRALGPERVFALILPERDSSDDSGARARILAGHLGVRVEMVDIAPALAAIGCYAERDAAVRRALPEYGDGWRFKIVIDGGIEGRINRFRLVAVSPAGENVDRPLGLSEYLQIVAATNFKQRIRKTLEYYHADRLNYAVVGTPNRLEYDQGFFVKNGDGSADVKPIAHLYKSQVYGMARFLGLPERVCAAVPTTDTYSLEQGQDEFYFALPYRSMDLALWALNHDVPATELARVLAITAQQADAVYEDIRTKRRTTRYLHARPVLVGEVAELDPH
ncbi:MAG TPA: NAD(+) synthase [Dokdonella sp.]|uniref:NAD(+) synthase n=1 Tax=Dokdonella sp. TaxID=2291710 RepID=UPI0025B86234|nr:NAD(+) synthase [Dokdonella sp.]MBX3691655.1 NAD(+) synthase [Dokdonella sp.]MCW5567388.1 NAD(+) synthase [Dokdonella sp.]HNR91633.1 NAD(+) synthase [Dokdonella sp.]